MLRGMHTSCKKTKNKNQKTPKHQILPSRLDRLLPGCYGPPGKYILWKAY